MYIILLSTLVAVLFSIGDSFATKYFDLGGHGWRYVLLGVVFNGFGVYVFGYVANHAGMGVSSSTILALNIIGNTLLGIYLFKDVLGVWQYLGIAFCVIGIVLVNIKG